MDDVIALSGTSKAIPTRSYTIDMLKEYHWRDLISFGNGFLIFILSLHMMIIVGFFDNIIHYRKIQNNHHSIAAFYLFKISAYFTCLLLRLRS